MEWKTYTKTLEEILCIGINLEGSGLALAEVKGRDFGNILILSLTLLFLEFEGDTTDGTTLNTLHQMGGVSSNLFHTHQQCPSPSATLARSVFVPCCEDAWKQ
jgi:hypothetical protein